MFPKENDALLGKWPKSKEVTFMVRPGSGSKVRANFLPENLLHFLNLSVSKIFNIN